MNKKNLLKIISMILCLLMIFSISVYAKPNDEINENIVIYDDVTFENESLIKAYEELDYAKKETLKENKDLVIVSIGEEFESELDLEGNASTRSVIKPSTMSGRITVARNRDATKYYIYFYVDWHRTAAIFLKDKMAVSWAGGSALIDSSCWLKKGNAYVQSPKLVCAEVGNNAFVAYEIGEYSNSYYMTVTINESLEPGLKNITGGFAHKIIGVSGISAGVDSSATLSFSAGFGTKFDTMTPAYTTSYLS